MCILVSSVTMTCKKNAEKVVIENLNVVQTAYSGNWNIFLGTFENHWHNLLYFTLGLNGKPYIYLNNLSLDLLKRKEESWTSIAE